MNFSTGMATNSKTWTIGLPVVEEYVAKYCLMEYFRKLAIPSKWPENDSNGSLTRIMICLTN